jgi:hypothetical protein
MIKRRALVSSSLAFIDVMACGLGAVLMLFILVDFDEVVTVKAPQDVDNTDNTDYYRIQGENNSLELEIDSIQQEITNIKERLSERIVDAAKAKAELSVYTRAVATIPETKLEESQPAPKNGDLIGLKIEGAKILILLDSSASMSDELLIRVLTGVADSSRKRLNNGAKWQQAKKIVKWIIDNAPQTSGFKILTYSDTPNLLNNSWSNKQTLSTNLPVLLSAVKPFGPTNLESALDYVNDNIGDYSSIYVITDGLPTKASGSSRLLNIGSCGVNIRMTVSQVSGTCREAIFQKATRTLKGDKKKIDVLLLPFEGDPRAAPLYYKWAKENNGMLFTPNRSWP